MSYKYYPKLERKEHIKRDLLLKWFNMLCHEWDCEDKNPHWSWDYEIGEASGACLYFLTFGHWECWYTEDGSDGVWLESERMEFWDYNSMINYLKEMVIRAKRELKQVKLYQ